MASESADDINVAVALSTALLLPNDLERNSKLSEYENYALMLQHSAQVSISVCTCDFFLLFFTESTVSHFCFSAGHSACPLICHAIL